MPQPADAGLLTLQGQIAIAVNNAKAKTTLELQQDKAEAALELQREKAATALELQQVGINQAAYEKQQEKEDADAKQAEADAKQAKVDAEKLSSRIRAFLACYWMHGSASVAVLWVIDRLSCDLKWQAYLWDAVGPCPLFTLLVLLIGCLWLNSGLEERLFAPWSRMLAILGTVGGYVFLVKQGPEVCTEQYSLFSGCAGSVSTNWLLGTNPVQQLVIQAAAVYVLGALPMCVFDGDMSSLTGQWAGLLGGGERALVRVLPFLRACQSTGTQLSTAVSALFTRRPADTFKVGLRKDREICRRCAEREEPCGLNHEAYKLVTKDMIVKYPDRRR